MHFDTPEGGSTQQELRRNHSHLYDRPSKEKHTEELEETMTDQSQNPLLELPLDSSSMNADQIQKEKSVYNDNSSAHVVDSVISSEENKFSPLPSHFVGSIASDREEEEEEEENMGEVFVYKSAHGETKSVLGEVLAQLEREEEKRLPLRRR